MAFYACFKRNIFHLTIFFFWKKISWFTSDMLRGPYRNLSISIKSFGPQFNHVHIQVTQPLFSTVNLSLEKIQFVFSKSYSYFYMYFLMCFLIIFLFSFFMPTWLKIRIFKEKVNILTSIFPTTHFPWVL